MELLNVMYVGIARMDNSMPEQGKSQDTILDKIQSLFCGTCYKFMANDTITIVRILAESVRTCCVLAEIVSLAESVKSLSAKKYLSLKAWN